ncbi:MAG: FGGY family carbohydrate kinase [Actinobacteria bacterium]|nr:FGGY family carbohydrate kinase [Actinomycetota bacterium]
MKSKSGINKTKNNIQNYLIGIDVGTSAVKISIIDLKGNLIYSNSKEYEINFLPDSFVQQKPVDWYGSLIYLLRDSLSQLDFERSKVLSIGISSQSNALVPVNENGDVLYPAILYLDKRALDICNSFKDTKEGERIYKLGGSTLKSSYTGPQISWIKKNEPDIYRKTYKFLTANGFIVQKLTGEYSQDYTQTGMTGIFDREKREWSEELLGYFGINKNKMPRIYQPFEIVGKTSKNFKEDSGLPSGIPVIAGTLDVASTMLGSGCVDIGYCFIEMGSVINITVLTDISVHDKNLQTYPSAMPNINIVAGSVDGAGGTIKWFLNQIYKGYGLDEHISDEKIFGILEEEMHKTEIGSGNLMFLPFMSGMRTPRSDLNTKGALLGLKVSTGKIDIFRSILEGCSYGLKYNLKFILEKGIDYKKAIVSGGASKNKFWLQMLSDILSISITRSYYDSGASIGSAMLAGIGVEAFNDFRQAKEIVCRYDLNFKPEKERTAKYDKYYSQYKNFIKELIFELHNLECI